MYRIRLCEHEYFFDFLIRKVDIFGKIVRMYISGIAEKEAIEMKNNDIVYIAADLIYQHPDNPRKNLGDLSELSESIKKKGIMQNLMVIPGHWDEQKEWHEEGYTLIIGHRRFAAGKLVEIEEFPCKIVTNMDQKEQVGMMLEENMQRNDLTIWEQAQGFQMMLDLGETEEMIAEKTGFSKKLLSTV